MYKINRLVNLVLLVLIISILISPAIVKGQITVTYPINQWEYYAPNYDSNTVKYPRIPHQLAVLDVPFIPPSNPYVFNSWGSYSGYGGSFGTSTADAPMSYVNVFGTTPISDTNPIPPVIPLDAPMSYVNVFGTNPIGESNPIPPVIPFSPYLTYMGSVFLNSDINYGAGLFGTASNGIGYGGGYAGLFGPDQNPDDFPWHIRILSNQYLSSSTPLTPDL